MKKNQTKTIAEIVNAYGGSSSNIIYAPTRRIAERFARALAEIKPLENIGKKNSVRVQQLVRFLKKEIHPECSIVKCLEKGVAFHHGMMPEMAKLEVEELYKSGVIKNLVCTTTLLEGVNLPADKIFIYRPWKKDRNNLLSDFDFGNLTGRAGRVRSSLNGSVYCIELEDEPWAKEKLLADVSKEIVPATNKATTEENKDKLIDNLDKPSTEIKAERSIIFTIIFLRQKGYQSKEELATYLKSKKISSEYREQIIEAVMKSVRGLKIPKEIVELNPTIDPILQDKLFTKMVSQEFKEWIVNKAPNSYGGSYDVPFEDRSFYWQFVDVAEKLNVVFDFVGSILHRQRRRWYSGRTPYSIAYYGIKWIEQKPTSYIIKRELARLEKKSPDELKKPGTVDRVILEVTEHINYEVRFELVKYFKLWADILDSKLTQEKRESKEIIRSLAIPEMLELGAYNPNVILMIRAGINRSAAIEASQWIQNDFKGNVIDWLIANESILDPIFRRHIKSIGLIPKRLKTGKHHKDSEVRQNDKV